MANIKKLKEKLDEWLQGIQKIILNPLGKIENLQYIEDHLENFMMRIYPEKMFLKKRQQLPKYEFGSERYSKEEYAKKLIKIIAILRNEEEIFGFDDFTPLKKEKEWSVGVHPKNIFFRKKEAK